MKPFFYFATLVLLSILYSACGKHIYILNNKEIYNLSKEARDPQMPVLVIYSTGDTLKGKVLKRRHNIVNGKSTWLLDGKDIPIENVTAYQDKEGYNISGGTYSRIYRGRIDLFYAQTDNSKLVSTYSSAKKQYDTKVVGNVETSFYMSKGSQFLRTNYDNIKELVSDYPPALKQFNKEFPPDKNHKYMGKDYRAFVRILKAYDKR